MRRTTPGPAPSCCAGASFREKTERCPPTRGCAAGWLHGEKLNTGSTSGGVVSVIPWPYRLLALTALGVALIGFGWIKGASHVQARWDAAIQQQALQTAAIRERQAQARVKVVTQYVDRVRVVREKGETIIKEVPVYVPVQADAACSINRGFVRLHDAAAAGELPEPARDADAASAGIALSAVAGTVAANYQTCHENAEQLRALQTWVREMKVASEQ